MGVRSSLPMQDDASAFIWSVVDNDRQSLLYPDFTLILIPPSSMLFPGNRWLGLSLSCLASLSLVKGDTRQVDDIFLGDTEVSIAYSPPLNWNRGQACSSMFHSGRPPGTYSKKAHEGYRMPDQASRRRA